MDQEDKLILQEIKQTVNDNNQMLKKLVFYGRANLWIRVAYWAILIFIAVGAVAIIKPFLSSLGTVYAPGGVQDSIKLFSTPSAIDELRAQFAE